jgi:hypothetical protein
LSGDAALHPIERVQTKTDRQTAHQVGEWDERRLVGFQRRARTDGHVDKDRQTAHQVGERDERQLVGVQWRVGARPHRRHRAHKCLAREHVRREHVRVSGEQPRLQVVVARVEELAADTRADRQSCAAGIYPALVPWLAPSMTHTTW